MTSPSVVDLFSGCRGWSVGAAALGIHDVGVEFWRPACETSQAAGFVGIQADVAHYPAEVFAGWAGLIASPPCQTFSMAGSKAGHQAIAALRSHMLACRHGWVEPAGSIADPKTELVLEPLRWAWAVRPRWIALEQVPAVLPLWNTMAVVLGDLGYETWCGVVDAADYGVAQHRKRAVLLASLDGHPQRPARTHGGAGQPPLVTMAEAVGWGLVDGPGMTVAGTRGATGGSGARRVAAGRVGFPRKADDRGAATPDGYRERDWFDIHEPAPTVTAKARSWQVQLSPGLSDSQPNRRLYDAATEPAPTIAFGKDAAGWRWVLTDADHVPEGRWLRGEARDPQWPFKRPALTLAGDPRMPQPGHKNNADNPDSPGRLEGALRLTVSEALALQSFPDGFPITGNSTAQYLQVGNAVPPLLSRALLHEVTTCQRRTVRPRTELDPIEAAEQAGLFG